NSREDVVSFTTQGGSGAVAETGDTSATFTATTTAGDYPAGVRVSLGSIDVDIDVTVSTDPPATLTIDLPAEVAAGAVFQVTATARDVHGNDTATALTWTADSAAEHLGDGWFRAPTSADVYRGEIQASAGDATALADLTVVAAAADRIDVSPAQLVAEQGATIAISAVVVDAYGNARADEAAWSADAAAGAVDAATGASIQWTAGASAGAFPAAVTVSAGGSTVTLAATISAGPAAEVILTAPAEVAAGAVFQASVALADAVGNALDDSVDWSGVGAISLGDGWFQAPTETGSYPGALVAEHATVSASHDLMVVPADPVTLQVTPNAVALLPGESVSFTASVADAFGNQVTGPLEFTAVLHEAGSITTDGTFEAGTTPGTYVDAITVKAGTTGLTGFATVVVTAPVVVDPPIVTGDDSGDGCQTGGPSHPLALLLALGWFLRVARRKRRHVDAAAC
ncbi:MAG: hypothetical protein ACI9MR_005194, partial [Myxococcota bacterium]